MELAKQEAQVERELKKRYFTLYGRVKVDEGGLVIKKVPT
jgi:hypothetical protein